MRRIILLSLAIFLLTINSYGQFTTDNITYTDKLELKNSNSWAIGGGVSNFIMHGDLRSIGTGSLGNFWNFGGYVFVDKMFNPLLGLELKFNYSKISGGAQYLSNIYEILYVPNAVIDNDLWFKGSAYGAEVNLIFSFTNLYEIKPEKLNFVGYFGIGYHQYDSALYERLADGTDNLLVDFGYNPSRNSLSKASSIYLTAQLGLKYRISKKVDIELRPSMYFNYEDHLDATISNKQDWEAFFVTHIGVAIKLGKKKVFTLWGAQKETAQFKIVDTDKDGVIDQLDKEPNTPIGVLVYGNGIAIDSDKDGIADYKDKCPLKFGLETNNGCPTNKDSDEDGILDENDLCPTVKGTVANKGCPNAEENTQNINYQIGLLAANIYFDTNSDKIKPISYATLDKIISLMKRVSDIKFSIEGHTDNINSDRYNLLLSQKRAASVRKYLIRNGIDATRLTSKGYGESRPKYSNETPGGRQLNRRVEIKPINTIE